MSHKAVVLMFLLGLTLAVVAPASERKLSTLFGSGGGFGNFDMGNMFGNDDFFGGSGKSKKVAKKVAKKGAKSSGSGFGGDFFGNDFFGGDFDDNSSKKQGKSSHKRVVKKVVRKVVHRPKVVRRPKVVVKKIVKKVVHKPRRRAYKAKSYKRRGKGSYGQSYYDDESSSYDLRLPSRIDDGSSIIGKYRRYWNDYESSSRRRPVARHSCGIDPKLKKKLIARLQQRMRRALQAELSKIKGAFKKAFVLSQNYVNRINFSAIFNHKDFQALFRRRCAKVVRPVKKIIIRKKVVKRAPKRHYKKRRHSHGHGGSSHNALVFHPAVPSYRHSGRDNIMDSLKKKILIGSSNPNTLE